jgi:hypothetical protein
MNPFQPGYGAPPYLDPSFAGPSHHHPHPQPPPSLEGRYGELPPGMHPGQFGYPQRDNRRVTASLFTEMIVGQDGLGASINTNELVPEAYTVQFGFVGVEPDTGGHIFIPTAQAIVNWKVDGQPQRRVMSIVSGASLSGVCNALDIKIKDFPNGGDATIGKRYKVQATLSRGLRANTQQPPTLVDQAPQSIGTGAGVTYAVPQDSGVTSFRILVASGSTGDTYDDKSVIASMSDAALPSPNLLGTYYPLKCCDWTPLPPGSQRVLINNGTGVTIFTQVIWGIDG